MDGDLDFAIGVVSPCLFSSMQIEYAVQPISLRACGAGTDIESFPTVVEVRLFVMHKHIVLMYAIILVRLDRIGEQWFHIMDLRIMIS